MRQIVSVALVAAALAAAPVADAQPPSERELRGLWITRWDFISPGDLDRLLRRAADAGFTAIFLQVRGRADALYRSRLEPWAEELSGTLGQDPGWDPLQLALDVGEELGLEIHAWMNIVPVWRGAAPPPETTPRHVYLSHPEWLMVDAQGQRMPPDRVKYVCLSPGIPAARDHVLAVIEDLLDHYPVDGVHLDYIRYYGRDFSHDPVSERRYAAALARTPGLRFGQWQRDQITELVRRAYALVQRYPDVQLTAAVWHNNRMPVRGSSGFRDYYQDSHAMTFEGVVDAILPMNYLRMDSRDAPFDERADDHVANAFGRKVYMGIHALGRITDPDPSGARMLENIAYARRVGADGVAIFASTFLDRYQLWDELRDGPFARPLQETRPRSGD